MARTTAARLTGFASRPVQAGITRPSVYALHSFEKRPRRTSQRDLEIGREEAAHLEVRSTLMFTIRKLIQDRRHLFLDAPALQVPRPFARFSGQIRPGAGLVLPGSGSRR